MWTHKVGRLAAAIALLSSLCAISAHGQNGLSSKQPPSLGDAARIAREQQKPRPTGKVITNDDIADLKGSVSIVGTEPPAPVDTGKVPAAGTPAPEPKTEVKDEAYWRAKFAEARKQLASNTKEADILQREYNLKEQQFYSDPNVALREQNNRADLNKTRDAITAKKADIEKDQQSITTLEDDLRRAGGDPGWARAPQP
jgi:hypothetical protein